LAVPVNLDDGGIDHGVFHIRLLGCRTQKAAVSALA
jgi:hypothetical protein